MREMYLAFSGLESPRMLQFNVLRTAPFGTGDLHQRRIDPVQRERLREKGALLPALEQLERHLPRVALLDDELLDGGLLPASGERQGAEEQLVRHAQLLRVEVRDSCPWVRYTAFRSEPRSACLKNLARMSVISRRLDVTLSFSYVSTSSRNSIYRPMDLRYIILSSGRPSSRNWKVGLRNRTETPGPVSPASFPRRGLRPCTLPFPA